MASAPQHQVHHSYGGHPPSANHHYEVRLPPIRDLGIVYRDEQAHTAPQPQQEYTQVQGHPSRHDWSRTSSGPGPAHSQHGTMPPPTDPSKPQYPGKPDGQYATPGVPLSAQGSIGPTSTGSRPGSGRGDPSSQSSLKRARSNSSMTEAPGRSPHTNYPPHTAYSAHPAPPGSFQQAHQAPPSQENAHPPTVFAQQSNSGYQPYVHPQSLNQRHYPVPPSAAHAHPPSNAPYPPPAPTEHWQQQQPPPPAPPQYQSAAPQGPYNNFPRTTPLVPESVETRSGAPVQDAKRAAVRQKTIAEIVENCNILYQFANRCANQPHLQPSPEELQDTSRRAALVVRLMDELRRLSSPEDLPVLNGADEHRPPKRPWEDTVDEDPMTTSGNRGEYSDDKIQSTAEQDMEIIRSKRATSAGGNAPGQPKSKYRKRSRATPPGKCHSCNIRETPEWRRGPDGARTLCNACGLHYAKLMRKRDKNGISQDGKPAITIESLRASTASARGAEQNAEAQAQQSLPPQSGLVPATYDQHAQGRSGPSPPHMSSQYPSPHPPPKSGPPPPHMQHSPHPQHPGAYSLMPVQGGHHPMMPPPPPPAHGEAGANVPAPPWLPSSGSSSGSGRPGYGGEHQAYMRTSHPPSHARASPQ